MRNPVLFENIWSPLGHATSTSSITLRDLAAIAAMQEILSIATANHRPVAVANAAVSYADTLLAELEKPTP